MAILFVLQHQMEPLGSWLLRAKLISMGINISIASIGRILKDMDVRGLTINEGNKGRKLTEKGSTKYKKINYELKRKHLQHDLLCAVQPANEKELVHLLQARKLMEEETARLAAIYATQEDIKALKNSLHMNKDTNTTLHELDCNFHILIGRASKNAFLHASLKSIINEKVILENRFASLFAFKNKNTFQKQHKAIYHAIHDRNPEKAKQTMSAHMQYILTMIDL